MGAFTVSMIIALVALAIGIALIVWSLIGPGWKSADAYGGLVVFGLGALIALVGVGTGGATGLVWWFVR